jgi:hypothetical protein
MMLFNPIGLVKTRKDFGKRAIVNLQRELVLLFTYQVVHLIANEFADYFNKTFNDVSSTHNPDSRRFISV